MIASDIDVFSRKNRWVVTLKLHRFPFMKLTIAMFLHALINNDTAVFSRKKRREGRVI